MNPPEPPAAPHPTLRQAQAGVLATMAALALLCLLWELWLAPTGSGTLALKALPLLPCVPGVRRHRLGTYRWLALLVWLYVLEGLVRATSSGAGEHGLSTLLAALEVALSLVLFALCTFYIRWRLRHAAEVMA